MDYFLLKTSSCNEIKSCRIVPGISSDHEIVEIVIKLGKQIRGPGLWKFNNSLLNDKTYKEETKLLIEKVWNENLDISDPRVKFDFLKYEIMRYSRKVSRIKAQNLRDKEFNLVDRLSLLDDKIINEKISDTELEEYGRLKQDLEYIEGIKSDGARIRSRMEQIELNEKSISFS